jgi:hypothetical protein
MPVSSVAGKAFSQRFGHMYSNNALDPERSRFFPYGRPYDIRTDTWLRQQASNKPPRGKTQVWEYFSAMDGLVRLTYEPTTLSFFSEEKKTWSVLGKSQDS